ncbi:MAG: DUF2304 domain-containing protein [Lachnospiraceae bacterium]|nr:DUF2304 domain-containing protein [Lachnospiraceae bacterium]
MTLKIQIIIIVLAGLGILYIGNLVRVRRLELKYALIWFLVGVLVIIFAANKNWLQGLSNLLGIELPINMLFFVGFLFVLMIIFTQTIVISNLTRKSKRLTQEVAMLNKRIDDMIAAGTPDGAGSMLKEKAEEHETESVKNIEDDRKEA